MKELLFKQFITEVKAAKQERIDKVVEIIDNACETVTEFDLQFCLLEVKANFDSLIMGGTKYTNFKATRDAINEKYTNVETFKAGLVEFKDALLNRNKSTETTKEEVKTVESKVGFTTVEEKQQEVVNEEVKIIMEDGPISDNMMQLLDEVKNCIGTELFTEGNFKEKISKLHGSGLLTKLLMSNENLKSDVVNSFGVEDITDEDISQLFSSPLGLKLLLKELNAEAMNYIIEVINDIEESQKEEVVVDSNTTFTNIDASGTNNTTQEPVTNEVNNNKSLIQQAIEKCNQDAEAISKDLIEAEQILRNNQVVSDVPNNYIMNDIVTEAINNATEEAAKVENKEVKVKQKSKNKNICKYEGCDNKTHTKGYCYKHYKELKEQGVIGGNKNAK